MEKPETPRGRHRTPQRKNPSLLTVGPTPRLWSSLGERVGSRLRPAAPAAQRGHALLAARRLPASRRFLLVSEENDRSSGSALRDVLKTVGRELVAPIDLLTLRSADDRCKGRRGSTLRLACTFGYAWRPHSQATKAACGMCGLSDPTTRAPRRRSLLSDVDNPRPEGGRFFRF